MSLWRQLTRGLRTLSNPTAAAQDVDDEVRDYFDQATAELIGRGRTPEQARREARLELGTTTMVGEEVRSYGWENTIGTALADLRYGARRLRATPGLTAVTILTLAIGIGGTTAILSAVNPILFASLPYPQAGRVMAVVEFHTDGRRSQGTFAMFHRFQERSRSLESIAVYRPWQAIITGGNQPERLLGQRVSAAYFRVLGVQPIAGRDFDPATDRPKGENVVILGDALWRRRFDADSSIIGRQISLNDTLFTVIGIMPAGFENVLSPEANLWALLQYDPSIPPHGREWGHHLGMIARLRSGVSASVAGQEVNAVGRGLIAEQHPETYDPNTSFTVRRLQDELTLGVKPALLVILAAVSLVLVIACVNVTNLLLARGVQRRAEFALRAALGAGRSRLTRQLLTESLLLSALGGLGGMAVAALGVRALVAVSPAGLPRAGAIGVNGAMFGFGFAIAAVIGLAVGVIPALEATRSDPQGDLQHDARQTSAHRRARGALVIAEVALALVLLVSSGLLLRSMIRLLAVPAGFDATELITMQVQVAGHRFDQDAAVVRFFDQALDAVQRVPGVDGAGFTEQLPMSGDRDEYGADFTATPSLPAEKFEVFRYAVTPGFLEAMRIPLRRGRVLNEHDVASAPLVVLISESLAHKRFHDADPIGQPLRIGPAGPFAIVGVVGNVRQLSLALTDSDAVYLNAAQSWFASGRMSLVVRARGGAAALAPAVRQAVWSVDKDQPVQRVATMDALLKESASERRFALILFEAFAIAALVLAAAGIYGVLAGSVAERTREIGVRAALGASRADIVRVVMRQAMTLTLVGIVIGLAGAVIASRAMTAMLFSVTHLDPATYLGVVVLLGVVAAIAAAVPAWRAARVDPAITLRAE